MFRTIIASITAVVTLSACESQDLGTLSRLEPTNEPGVYQWQTMADAIYPNDDANAEQARLRQLARRMQMNDICPAGYRVSNRTAVKKSEGILDDIYEVYYTVRCA